VVAQERRLPKPRMHPVPRAGGQGRLSATVAPSFLPPLPSRAERASFETTLRCIQDLPGSRQAAPFCCRAPTIVAMATFEGYTTTMVLHRDSHVRDPRRQVHTEGKAMYKVSGLGSTGYEDAIRKVRQLGIVILQCTVEAVG
jgi:hypothetical protein